MVHAALAEIDRVAELDLVALEIAPALRTSYQNRLRPEEPSQEHRELEHARRQARRVRLEIVNVERRRLLKLRREREIGDDVLHKLMREIDLEEMRLATLGVD
jgi:hypothetical protein